MGLVQSGLFAGAEDIEDFSGGSGGAEPFGDKFAFIEERGDDGLQTLVHAGLSGWCEEHK